MDTRLKEVVDENNSVESTMRSSFTAAYEKGHLNKFGHNSRTTHSAVKFATVVLS